MSHAAPVGTHFRPSTTPQRSNAPLRAASVREANANAIVALVTAIVVERKPDTRPVVLIGTSAGGLAALLATDRLQQLALWIGLDPVDAFGQSRRVAHKLRVPAVVLRAPTGACNVAGSARRIAT